MLERVTKAWNKFWFEPQSPLPMCWYRIFLGTIVLQLAVVHLDGDFLDWYGRHAIVTINTIKTFFWHGKPHLDLLLLLPQSDTWVRLFHYMFIAAAACLTVGLFTRLSAILCFLMLVSLHNHCPINLNAGEVVMRLGLLSLAFSRAGDALSLDSLLRSLRSDWRKTGFAPPLSAPWGQRLLQLQINLIYIHSVYSKITGEVWQNGSAIYYSTRIDDLVRLQLPLICNQLWLCKLLTWGALVIEAALGGLVWWPPLRYWILAGGVGLHLGIDLLINLPMFEWLMIISFIVYIYPQDLTGIMSWINARIGAPGGILAYNGECLPCVRFAGLLKRLDVFSRLSLVDYTSPEARKKHKDLDREKAHKVLALKTSSGWQYGPAAARWLSLRLPALWPSAPLYFLPGSQVLLSQTGAMLAPVKLLLLGGKCGDKATDSISIPKMPAAAAGTVMAALALVVLPHQLNAPKVDAAPSVSYAGTMTTQREELESKVSGKPSYVPARYSAPLQIMDWEFSLSERPYVTGSNIFQANRSPGADTQQLIDRLVATRRVEPYDESQWNLWDRLAQAYCLETNFKNADELYRLIWQQRAHHARIRQVFDPSLPDVMRKLAAVYRDWGIPSSAQSCLKQAMDYESKGRQSDKLRTARDWENLGVLYYYDGDAAVKPADRRAKFIQSNECFDKSLALYREADANYRWPVVCILNNKALVLRDMGETEAAERTEREAAQIKNGLSVVRSE